MSVLEFLIVTVFGFVLSYVPEFVTLLKDKWF